MASDASKNQNEGEKWYEDLLLGRQVEQDSSLDFRDEHTLSYLHYANGNSDMWTGQGWNLGLRR